MSSDEAAATNQEEEATEAEPLRLLENAPPFHYAKHIQYVASLAEKLEGTFEGAVTNHLKLSGVYWSVATMMILCNDDLETVDKHLGLVTPKKEGADSIVDWIDSCFDESTGGYGGDTGQDGHVLYTLSAIQILAMADCLETRLQNKKERVVAFIASLQQADGSFVGDAGLGEVDTRFSYCALCALSLLGRLDAINVDNAVAFVNSCQNTDGYGSCPGAESHAGQVFCCIGALSIAHALPTTPTNLQWWLSERQCDSGGLNGRSEKQADVCYSWWILSSMSILGILHYIDTSKLAAFILKAQDPDDGGIADRPDDMVDVFHTFFGIAGLSLLGELNDSAATTTTDDGDTGVSFGIIDPVYALPVSTVQRLGLQGQVVLVDDAKKKKQKS